MYSARRSRSLIPTSIAFVLVVACSGSSGSSPADPATNLDAGAADPSADASCPFGSHLDDGERHCVTRLTIATSPQTTGRRDHHTTNIITTRGGPYLYVMGGTNAWTTIYDDIVRAPISADGSLGTFETVGHLPQSRAGHTTALMGNHLVVSGGNSMDVHHAMTLLDSTIVATIDADGAIGTWQPGPPLPMAVMHHTCNAKRNWMYCVGGRINGNFTSTLAVRAELRDDGTLSDYLALPPPQQSFGFHQALIHQDALYVMGGMHRDSPMSDFARLSDIFRLDLQSDGSTGAWRAVGRLPEVRYAAAAEAFGDDVYLLGGQNGNDDVVSSILRGTFASDGSLADFSVLPVKLSTARMHVHQTPIHDHFIYSVGGRTEADKSIEDIDIGTFD